MGWRLYVTYTLMFFLPFALALFFFNPSPTFLKEPIETYTIHLDDLQQIGIVNPYGGPIVVEGELYHCRVIKRRIVLPETATVYAYKNVEKIVETNNIWEPRGNEGLICTEKYSRDEGLENITVYAKGDLNVKLYKTVPLEYDLALSAIVVIAVNFSISLTGYHILHKNYHYLAISLGGASSLLAFVLLVAFL